MTTLLDTLRRRVAGDIAARQLLPRGAPLLIGLSGGRDSSVLAHLLADLQVWGGWHLRAVHFDHGLRGAAAAQADRDCCQTLCDRLRLPLTCQSLAVQRAPGVSLEEAARNARRDSFRRLAIDGKIPIVVTAHHADDRVETVLFRILRGTGLRGLPGIAWQRSEALNQPPVGLGFSLLQFHRPLLGVWREEITSYARAAQLTWIDDASNDTDAHDRNRIRRSLLPKLALDFNPEVRRHLWDLAEDAADWLKVLPPPDSQEPAPTPFDLAAAAFDALAPAAPSVGADGADGAILRDPAAATVGDPAAPDGEGWPWPTLPLVLDGATLLGLGRARAIPALQALLEAARRRTGFSGAPSRAHYNTLYAMLAQPDAPAQLSLPGGWQVRRVGTAPNVRLLIDHP